MNDFISCSCFLASYCWGREREEEKRGKRTDTVFCEWRDVILEHLGAFMRIFFNNVFCWIHFSWGIFFQEKGTCIIQRTRRPHWINFVAFSLEFWLCIWTGPVFCWSCDTHDNLSMFLLSLTCTFLPSFLQGLPNNLLLQTSFTQKKYGKKFKCNSSFIKRTRRLH